MLTLTFIPSTRGPQKGLGLLLVFIPEVPKDPESAPAAFLQIYINFF